eukprot:1690913-Amphidinium_carterae.1
MPLHLLQSVRGGQCGLDPALIMLRVSLRRLARQPGRKSPPAAASAQRQLVPQADEWEEVSDKATSQRYWWNKRTNETTALGAPKPGPNPWQEVKDASGQSYWWNKETNATTAVGAPKPSALAGHAPPASAVGGFGGGGGLMGALADGMAWG